MIGFCMGGGYALALATGHGYAAASTNYGGCPADAERALAGACPVVGSYGAKDRSPMGARAAARLEAVLTKISGTRYHEPSARDARCRIAAFFGRHLTT